MSTAKNKILISIDWFLPGTNSGGPVRSIANLVKHLPEIEFWIITRDTDYLSEISYDGIQSDQWTTFSQNVHVFYVSGQNLNTMNIEKIILETEIKTLYVNGVYSKYFSILPLKIGKKNNLKTIVAPRGMFSSQAMKIKRTKKMVFAKLMNARRAYKDIVFHITSEHEQHEINSIIKPLPKCVIIPNLPRIQIERIETMNKIKGSLFKPGLLYLASKGY